MAIGVQHRMNPTVEGMLNAQRAYDGGSVRGRNAQAQQQAQQNTPRNQAFAGRVNQNAQQAAGNQNQAVNQDAQERRTRQQQQQGFQLRARGPQPQAQAQPQQAQVQQPPRPANGPAPSGFGGSAAEVRVRGQGAYAAGATYTALRGNGDGAYVLDDGPGPQINETAQAARFDRATTEARRTEQAQTIEVDPQVAEDIDTSRFAGPASYRQAIDFATRAYEAVQNRNQSLLGGHQPLALSV